MKIILGLYIILYYAQLSNAALFHSKHFLSARSSAKSGRSLNLPRQPHQLASSWYASWHSADFPPSEISWKKYDQIIYAFA
jgi:GH18 family chitinase